MSAIAVGRPVARTAPAQIPACRIQAPGSSEILVSASGVTKEKERPLKSRTGPNGDPWAWHVELIEQIVKALPRETAALTPAIEPLPQSTHGLVEELLQPAAVARNPIVVVVATELERQHGEQFF